jgi:cytochrome P450
LSPARTPGSTLADLPGPRGLPGLGSALSIRPSSVHLTVERYCRRFGPIYRVSIGPRTFVVVGDPDLINAILRDRPDKFRRARELATLLDEIGVKGVFSAEGDAWRRQRRSAVHALNVNHLHRYFGVIRLASERLYARLRAAAADAAPLEIDRDFTAFTLDVTYSLAFGHDLNALGRADTELQRHIEFVFRRFGRRVSAPLPYWRLIRLPADRALDRSLDALRVAVGGFVDEAREQLRERPELRDHPETFLQAMLATQPADARDSKEELFGNALTLLLAGQDTTAHTLAWTTWILAREPRIQARLAADALELLGDARFPPDHGTADRFQYGEAVLRESMRLKSVASILLLESIEDTDLRGFTIPAGTNVLLLTRFAATQDASFARGQMLDPDRWLREPDGPRRSKGFLTFGSGPRFCPGRNLAFLESKAALAMMARNFEVVLDPAAPAVREQFSFTTIPRGLRVLLRERLNP